MKRVHITNGRTAHASVSAEQAETISLLLVIAEGDRRYDLRPVADLHMQRGDRLP